MEHCTASVGRSTVILGAVKKLASIAILSSLPLASCSTPPTDSEAVVEHLVPEIISTHSFDSTSFTQGLELDGDELIVGTGQYGGSRIYRSSVDGQESVSQSLDPEFFGEGITKSGDAIWQLTWNEGVAFKRDADTLEELDRVSYNGQGWGICSTDDALITSDGSSTLTFRDPETFAENSTVDVTLDGSPVGNLNELECVDGEVYANIFLDTDIMRIDPNSGEVTAVIDASNIPNNATPDTNNVLNGIAHIPDSDRFYITGKRWPDLYEVRFVPAD
ncbi:glutaminyl-peptide cyclotransferase [Corynebacterium glutamicum]|uniref:glutaminyl-peptide cyclotransferase n=1 Tax=Corynebacterium glutamicum TaxID=1718 RepID=UPI0005AB7B7F|nr:glutaminyl-peptide cyclotransferase [Corynebacterium glutamicum]MBA4571394.1 glutaminyl-peptide cyclotransferase [Corynebacterium glutamicum]MBA4573615.1 glutaminyl-peptide cyclotransferase [Corynebacterium glutamicum]MBA4577114.1 glutaminyl-peptide cyclotransferase [Corynebacterium glutamicum]MBA4580031.1 glutaminyl-peptide cyclotransferase [Corynebacterium glutamicum]MBA4582855.1 glutaminyl-peptide cyclotransferase [Corynebacterium glutamicum]